MKSLLVLFVASGFSISALGQISATSSNTSTASQPDASFSWIGEAGKAYVLNAVPPPPAIGSNRDTTDFQAVLKAQAQRTADEIKEALADQKFSIGLIAGPVGPDFTPENYPITFDFLHRVLVDERLLNSPLQQRYKRDCPYQQHQEIKNLFPTDSFAYPSGHASDSRILTLVLTELFPDKGTALLARDNVIAQSRVKAGLNYPSDIVAGRALAHALMFVLQDNPAFQGDMTKAKVEIAARTKSTNGNVAK